MLAAHGIGNRFTLQILQCHHHGGTQEIRHADSVLMGLVQHLPDRHLKTGQIQESSRFQRTGQMPCIVTLSAGRNGARIFLEAIFHLFLRGFFQTSKDTVHRRDGNAIFLLQIFRSQGFQENQCAVAVGEGMKKFHRNALFVGDHTEGAFAHLLAGHTGKRIAGFLSNRGGTGNLLQIVPEYPSPQSRRNGRKPPHRHIQRRL